MCHKVGTPYCSIKQQATKHWPGHDNILLTFQIKSRLVTMRVVARLLLASFIVVVYQWNGIIVQCHDTESASIGGDPYDENSSSGSTSVLKTDRNLFLFGSNSCPPSGFDAKQDFNVDLYLGRWFVQKQIPVAYQPIEALYCVTATYTRDTNFCIFCNYAPRIDILNQAREGSVDGEKLGGAVRFFRGIIRRPRSDPAKITVGFGAPFQPRSSYWVVAAGLYADILLGEETPNLLTSDYEWAIVTGGAPSLEGVNGTCKPNPGQLNFLGMWMFARDGVPPEGVIAAIEAYALNVLKLDTTAWVPVAQEGCVYD